MNISSLFLDLSLVLFVLPLSGFKVCLFIVLLYDVVGSSSLMTGGSSLLRLRDWAGFEVGTGCLGWGWGCCSRCLVDDLVSGTDPILPNALLGLTLLVTGLVIGTFLIDGLELLLTCELG